MDYVKVLGDLLSIDTTVPPGRNYHEAVDYLHPLFQELGFDTEEVLIPEEHAEGRAGRVNLICHRRNPGKPRLIFYGHIDVVPAAGWDAFRPRIENGKMYGRGAADMKGAIISLLLGFEYCKGKSLPYDISVMITTDEELSQASQLRYLAQFLQPVSGANVFSLDNSFGYVSVTGLGVLQMEVKVLGKSVHSGLSHLGENAVEKAGPVVNALLKLKKQVTGRKSQVEANPETGLSKMEARLNINMISGGLKVNIVPDQCLITIDRRLIPEEDVDEAKKEILDTLSAVPDVRWEVTQSLTIPPLPPSEGPMIDKLADIIKQVTGKTGKYGEMGSGDLSVIVTREWGGKEFGLGVIGPGCNVHGKDEFVYLKNVEDLARIIAMFVSS